MFDPDFKDLLSAFDANGTDYLIVAADRSWGDGPDVERVFILFVGTHAQYDAIDVAKL